MSDKPFKSVIPDWCGNAARELIQTYGFDPAVLEGAIAAALHHERQRAAEIAERGVPTGHPQVFDIAPSAIAAAIRTEKP